MKKILLAVLAATLLLLSACSEAGDNTRAGISHKASDDTAAASSLTRNNSPSVSAADASALRQGNTAFAADLYGVLRSDPSFAHKNIFFSPYSISEALAMTYAGARGATVSQISSALHFTLPDARLHAAFGALDLALMASRAVGQGQVPRTLEIANSLWGQAGAAFEQPFLDTLAVNYGAGIQQADFKNQSDAARAAINDWVAGKTRNKITDILFPGSISSGTRLVLVNAAYFNGGWSHEFWPGDTADGTFHGVQGNTTVQLMKQTQHFAYGAGSGWRAITLPYDGGLSFTAILPDNLAAFEPSLNARTLASIDGALKRTLVALTLPRFKIPGATFSLTGTLKTLGITDAFTNEADFSGISTRPDRLKIDDVLHQAYISVDEKGTEAAAATAVLMALASARPLDMAPQPVILTLDRPFIFLIRDSATGAILFLGRYVGG